MTHDESLASGQEKEEGEKKGINWVRALLIIAGLFLLTSTAVCCGGPFTVGAVMNSGEVQLNEIDDTWEVRGDVGEVFKTSRSRYPKAAPVKEALRSQCAPMRNGIRVLFNHLWYNAITDGYDGRLTLEASGQSYDMYILYIWGNKLFLRDEASAGGYVNRVLSCELTFEDWTKLAREE